MKKETQFCKQIHRFWLAAVRAPLLNGEWEFQATNQKRFTGINTNT